MRRLPTFRRGDGEWPSAEHAYPRHHAGCVTFSHYALLTTTTEGSLYMLCPWENLKSRWRLIPCYKSPRTWRPNSEHPTLRCSDSKTHWVFWDIKWMVLSIWQQILLYAWTHRLLQIKLKFKWLEGNFLENSHVSHIWGPPPPACSSVGCWE